MKTKTPIKTIPRFAAGVAGLLLCSALGESAHAQNSITWNVADGGVWDTTTANWAGGSNIPPTTPLAQPW